MSVYLPPLKLVPIFDRKDFIYEDQELTIGEANSLFVRYPNFQGSLLRLQTTEFYNTSTFEAPAIFNDDITLNGDLTLNGSIDVSGNITANLFIGDLSGNSTSTNKINLSGSGVNQSFYMPFATLSEGTTDLKTDLTLTYNPSTNILSTEGLRLNNNLFFSNQNSTFNWGSDTSFNYLLVSGNGRFMRFRRSGATNTRTGIMYSSFDGTHFTNYADGNNLSWYVKSGSVPVDENDIGNLAMNLDINSNLILYGNLDLSNNNIINVNELTSNLVISDLSGNANTATTATNVNNINLTSSSTNAEFFPIFSPNLSGYTSVNSDGSITYNPFLNRLTIPNLLTSNISSNTNITIDADIDMSFNDIENVNKIVSSSNIIIDPSNTLIIDGDLDISFNDIQNVNIISSTQNITINASDTLLVHSDIDLSGNLIMNANRILYDQCAVKICLGSGQTNQYQQAIAIGNNAGNSGQGTQAISIGKDAGYINQGSQSIAIGFEAGYYNQASQSVAIGWNAGYTGQGIHSVAIGYRAGETNQSKEGIAIGLDAGSENQGEDAIAFGQEAGQTDQGELALAFGYSAGANSQGTHALAMGERAGNRNQGGYAVAIGRYAGQTGQGNYAIAIGTQAGRTNQHANSIILNATGNTINSDGTSRLYIDPIRFDNTPTNKQIINYNTSTKELVYSDTLSINNFVSSSDITIDPSNTLIVAGNLDMSYGDITIKDPNQLTLFDDNNTSTTNKFIQINSTNDTLVLSVSWRWDKTSPFPLQVYDASANKTISITQKNWILSDLITYLETQIDTQIQSVSDTGVAPNITSVSISNTNNLLSLSFIWTGTPSGTSGTTGEYIYRRITLSGNFTTSLGWETTLKEDDTPSGSTANWTPSSWTATNITHNSGFITNEGDSCLNRLFVSDLSCNDLSVTNKIECDDLSCNTLNGLTSSQISDIANIPFVYLGSSTKTTKPQILCGSGTTNTTDWEIVTFDISFNTTPYVVAQIFSDNTNQAALQIDTTGLSPTSGFRITARNSGGSRVERDFYYIAIGRGN